MFSGIVLQCPRLSQNCVVRVKGNESWGVKYAKYYILNVFSLKSVWIVLGAISPPNWTFKKRNSSQDSISGAGKTVITSS